ncbi:MAG TPA: hypothetical protein VGQ83_04900 [Polyangia bacterium]|jgi:hypothetical protein
MRRARSGVVLCALLAATAARAAEPPAPASAPAPLGLSHYHQAGLTVVFGSGYRGLVRYDGSPTCDASGKTFCTGRLPAFMDLAGSFGLTRALAAIVDLRLGLEQDFTHSHPLALAPGIKYYIDPEDRLKFFATLQLVLDFTAQLPGVARTDVGVRNANGLQLDLGRHFGVFVQFGETIAFVRFFRFELDLGGGLEVRFP